MLSGLHRADGVPITSVANPLLNGYDTAAPASGFGVMTVQTSVPEGAVIACGLIRDGLAQAAAFQFHDAGGQSIENLDSSAATGTAGVVAPYQNAEWWIAEAVRVATVAGKAVNVARIYLNQGEADVARSRGWWLTAAGVTCDEMISQVARLTGQAVPPVFYVQQTGGYMHNSALNLHLCKLDQLDFVRGRGGVLVGPLYPYLIDNSDGKGVHKVWSEYIRAYEVGVWAAVERDAGRAWNLLPGDPARSGNVVTIPVSVRPDETLVAASGVYANYGGDPAHLGLEAVGGSIVSVNLLPGAISVEVSGAVSAIRYAMQRDPVDYRTMVDAAGCGYSAHRGLIKTSLTRSVRWGGVDFTLERWLPSFEAIVA